jgi:transcriptional regulator with XRE-family HTH domain
VLGRFEDLWEAARIRLAARATTLTQKSLARATRVPEQTLSNWRTGTSAPRDLDVLTAVGAKLAEWAGVGAPTQSQWSQWMTADRAASAARTGESSRKLAGLPVPLPSDTFLARPHIEEPAVDALLAEARGDRGRIVALAGMSGTGKTSSAVSIARDPRIERRYPDGIWWLDVRRAPSARGCQEEILRVLGEPLPDSTHAIRSVLQDRLTGLRCLIVLDNLTSPDFVEAVDVLGQYGALLVTTIDRDNLPAGIRLIEVGQFHGSGARELLCRYSGETDLPAAAIPVLHRCGGLPLALAICGAMMAEGYGWDDLAALLESANLGRLNRWFRDYPHRNLLAALEVGIGALTDEERTAYGALAVFTDRGPVPITAAARLWSLDDTRTRLLIKSLSRRSLLRYRDDGTFLIHDLLFQYLRAAAGDELPDIHARLAAEYLGAWGGLHAGLPNIDEADGYAITNLAFHLEQAGQPDQLHRLLALETATEPARNLWFTVHDRNGSIEAYLADIDRARRCAERGTDSASTPEGLATHRALEMLYHVVKATLTTIAAKVPASLMSALVRRGVWSIDTALTYAHTITDPLARTRALAALARLPAHPDVDRQLLLTQTEVAAAAVPDDEERAWAFAALIPVSPSADRPDLFEKTMAAADEADQETHVWTLSRLARHIPDLVRDRLLAIARSERVNTDTLLALAQAIRWVPELRPPVDAQIGQLPWPSWRLCYLITRLPGTTEPERTTLLTEIRAAAAELDPTIAATGSSTESSDLLGPLLSSPGGGPAPQRRPRVAHPTAGQ